MTYDLAVWKGDRPDESNAAETFTALYGQYIGRDDQTPPTPAIRAYVESLLDRWCRGFLKTDPQRIFEY
ncbi:hypothetical protein [Dactylosporangium darangshiense]|uniref:Uncharacterized protein n=1 Tax=Dactylosporangium darangshiense TaxID=579108 RepID=A0ABP8DWF4_9ACTN